MKIGLTYDLRGDPSYAHLSEEETAEYDGIETIEAIAAGLQRMGHKVEWVGHIQYLVAELAEGKRWDLIFNIASGRFGRCREAQIPALLDAYRIPHTFADSYTLSLCLDKGLTKSVIQAHGIKTAPYKVIHQLEELASIDLTWPLFAKPLSEGSCKGIHAQSNVKTAVELKSVCQQLMETFGQPALIETYLPGREFTVCVIGTGDQAKVLGVLEVKARLKEKKADCIFLKQRNLSKDVDFQLVSDAEAQQAAAQALQAHLALGCRDVSRSDFRSDAHQIPHFLEINPIAGFHPTRSPLAVLCRLIGLSYDDLLRQIIRSALERCSAESHIRLIKA